MSHRFLIGLAAGAFASLFAPGATLAQISPADMRSGSLRVLTGTAPVELLTVPGGSVFVLTDIEWYSTAGSGDASPVSLNLYGDGVERWRARGGYQLGPTTSFGAPWVQAHFSTGIVFDSGDVITFESASQLSARSYSVNWSGYVAPTGTVSTGDAGAGAPRPAMQQNVPNPFHPETEIRFELPQAGSARLAIYDASGRLVRSLIDGMREAGDHRVVWDGRADGGEALAAGAYFYELTTDRGRESRKAILLR